MALHIFSMGFMGTFYPGMKVNPLDLSPNYAGTLMAITNGIGALTGILSPYIVGVMTPNFGNVLAGAAVGTMSSFTYKPNEITSSLTEWRAVFCISFGIFVATTVVYVIWASGDVQPWNYPPETSIENGRKKSDEASGTQSKSVAEHPLQSNFKLKE